MAWQPLADSRKWSAWPFQPLLVNLHRRASIATLSPVPLYPALRERRPGRARFHRLFVFARLLSPRWSFLLIPPETFWPLTPSAPAQPGRGQTVILFGEAPAMADQWFIVRDDKKHGPYPLVQMQQFAASGRLLPIDM